jgi:hypothetical protein
MHHEYEAGCRFAAEAAFSLTALKSSSFIARVNRDITTNHDHSYWHITSRL